MWQKLPWNSPKSASVNKSCLILSANLSSLCRERLSSLYSVNCQMICSLFSAVMCVILFCIYFFSSVMRSPPCTVITWLHQIIHECYDRKNLYCSRDCSFFSFVHVFSVQFYVLIFFFSFRVDLRQRSAVRCYFFDVSRATERYMCACFWRNNIDDWLLLGEQKQRNKRGRREGE